MRDYVRCTYVIDKALVGIDCWSLTAVCPSLELREYTNWCGARTKWNKTSIYIMSRNNQEGANSRNPPATNSLRHDPEIAQIVRPPLPVEPELAVE